MKKKVEALNNMQGHEIVWGLVRSLETPLMKIRNSAKNGFWRDGHFYGSIALNTILHMLKVKDVRDVMEVKNHGGDWPWPKELEAAIDELRRGNIPGFNKYLISSGKPVIYSSPGGLPKLGDNSPPYYLSAYRDLAESQKYYMSFDIQSMHLDWQGNWKDGERIALVRHPKLSALGMVLRVRVWDIAVDSRTEMLSLRTTYKVYGYMKIVEGLYAPINDNDKHGGPSPTFIFPIEPGPSDLMGKIHARVHKDIRSFLESRGLIKYPPEKDMI